MCSPSFFLPWHTIEFCFGELHSQLFMVYNKMFAIKQCLGSVFCLQYVCSSSTACLLSFPQKFFKNYIHQPSTLQIIFITFSSLNKRKKSYPRALVSSLFITTFQTELLSFFFMAAQAFSMQDLSSQPGIDSAPSALEAPSLNHWTPGKPYSYYCVMSRVFLSL